MGNQPDIDKVESRKSLSPPINSRQTENVLWGTGSNGVRPVTPARNGNRQPYRGSHFIFIQRMESVCFQASLSACCWNYKKSPLGTIRFSFEAFFSSTLGFLCFWSFPFQVSARAAKNLRLENRGSSFGTFFFHRSENFVSGHLFQMLP